MWAGSCAGIAIPPVAAPTTAALKGSGSSSVAFEIGYGFLQYLKCVEQAGFAQIGQVDGVRLWIEESHYAVSEVGRLVRDRHHAAVRRVRNLDWCILGLREGSRILSPRQCVAEVFQESGCIFAYFARMIQTHRACARPRIGRRIHPVGSIPQSGKVARQLVHFLCPIEHLVAEQAEAPLQLDIRGVGSAHSVQVVENRIPAS